MANKRMFTIKIVGSDAFLDMPASTRELYFQLCMRADDDGFLGNPKGITRYVGASEDDLKKLIDERFLLTFDNGAVAIKHWKMHNSVAKDRYKPTQYTDEANMLYLKSNGAYTLDPSKGITYAKRNEAGLVKETGGETEEPATVVVAGTDPVHISQSDVQQIMDAWNALESFGIKRVSKIKSSSKRYNSICARVKEYSLEEVLAAIENIKYSDFLQGKGSSKWVITFDWFVLPNNFPKVLEGNYNDKELISETYEDSPSEPEEQEEEVGDNW